MTLRRKMGLQIGAMVAGLMLLGAAAMWGIAGLHQDFGSAIAGYEELRRIDQASAAAAIAGYEELRHVYEVSSHAAVARTLLSSGEAGQRPAMAEIQQAATLHKLFMAGTRATGGLPARTGASAAGTGSKLPMAPDAAADPDRAQQLRQALQTSLADAQSHLWNVIAGGDGSVADSLASINRALKQASDLAAEVRRGIQRNEQAAEAKRQAAMAVLRGRVDAADHKRAATIVAMAALSGLIIAAGIALGVYEYRSVTRPLGRLREGVRQLAEGKLSQRIEPAGHAEFSELAMDFNCMAAELDELYRDLEQKVAQKSKELARSERLASVGYLAAGVAHEINNPIGIIAGYAELSAQQLRGNTDPAAIEAAKSLAVIGEEAFRCKQIIEKLLSLAGPGEERRGPVSLAAVAGNVVSMVGGLQEHSGRRLVLDVQRDGDLEVLASEGEMKQVVLNLTLNALESLDGSGGQVTLRVRRTEKMVELSVEDTGRGMGPEVLEHVFEPFFTAKRGSGKPGTGLGLSITHAIVEARGGSIAACSGGPGKGSRFVVSLPAAKGGPA